MSRRVTRLPDFRCTHPAYAPALEVGVNAGDGAHGASARGEARVRAMVAAPAGRENGAILSSIVPAKAEIHCAKHAGLWNMGPRLRGDDSR
jgi:hypothetical protein